MKQISLQLSKAVETFELNYKETLNNSKIDTETVNVLYDLGADIKHLFDEVITIIEQN